jgi:hypothetical protein
LKTQRPENEALPGRIHRLYGDSFLWMSRRSSLGARVEVTMRWPPDSRMRLIGWSPYQAHDSTPLHRVSSTQIVTWSSFGS